MGSVAVGVVGSGTMGRGIAQVAAAAGHPVVLADSRPEALASAQAYLVRIMARLVEKGRMAADEAEALLGRITYVSDGVEAMAGCGLVIEAVVEDLGVKHAVLQAVEVVSPEAILATNTSSLSVTGIGAGCARPARVLGLHFFNPAPLMPLVEVVPGLETDADVLTTARSLVDGWGKTTVLAKDTPGFIVNRVARPFYGEALRLLEEGVADAATIDAAMRGAGFRMGPFELMDLIGNDINYTVTETVFAAFYYDPRYRPAFTQKRMVEAGRLGRKRGRGYFDYRPGATPPTPADDPALVQAIADRIVAMLINEAADAVFWQVASVEDVDLAMTKGVNYPRGLLRWADDVGLAVVLARLEALQQRYGEDRYRPSPLLREKATSGTRFHPPTSP